MKKRLTWEQSVVVAHDKGHSLVQAVPGSGKTTTLIKRIERLVKSGVNPRSILVLMYNKSAQEDFAEKLKSVLSSGRTPEVRTFHSLAMSIVNSYERQHAVNTKKLITSNSDKYREIIHQAYQVGFNTSPSYSERENIAFFELFINKNRVQGITPSDAELDPTLQKADSKNVRGYRAFCDLLEKEGLSTFDDYLVNAAKYAQQAAGQQREYFHIIVDEYQDVNLVQHNLVRSLTTPNTSVMVVGDINQCIYEFRGANPDFIGGLFERDFKDSKKYHLSCTFRFGHKLSIMANSVIRRNPGKIERLCVSHPNAPRTKVQLHSDDCLLGIIQSLPPITGSQAIISRTNAGLAAAEIALRLNNTPYQLLSGKPRVHELPEVGLLIVGVALCVYGNFRLLDNHPNKKAILFNFLRKTGFRWGRGEQTEALNSAMSPNVDCNALLMRLHEDEPDIGKGIIESTGKYKDGEQAIAIFKLLKSIGFFNPLIRSSVRAQETNHQERTLSSIESFLEASKVSVRRFLALLLKNVQPSSSCTPFVLTTLHGSKGLEWDRVVVTGLHDSEFPGASPKTDAPLVTLERATYSSTPSKLAAETSSVLPTSDSQEVEQERRLFYVGITRAKQQLHLVAPVDKGLITWLDKAWDSTPKRNPTATRFLFEAGITSSVATSNALYSGTEGNAILKLSKFHQWYIKSVKSLKV